MTLQDLSPWEEAPLIVPSLFDPENILYGVLLGVSMLFCFLRFVVPVTGGIERKDIGTNFGIIAAGMAIAIGIAIIVQGGAGWGLALGAGVAMLLISSESYWKTSVYRPERRPFNVTNIYKDLAHAWVGGMLGTALYMPSVWVIFAGLNIVELTAFFTRRKKS